MTQFNTDLIPAIRKAAEMELPDDISFAEMKDKLSYHINELIQHDFQKLVTILYRIDVSEPKLKYLLKENPGTDAGLIIADLMIERQEQKLKSRQEYRKDENISDDERW